MNSFGILAWPAFSTKDGNPYNYLIYSELQRQGFTVHEFSFNFKDILKVLLVKRIKIFHIHWPTVLLSYGTELEIKKRLLRFKYLLKFLKFLGVKVVWTVHNLEAHEQVQTELQELLSSILYTYVDGFISLNERGISSIKSFLPDFRNRYFKYIPHPHYAGYYSNTIPQSNAREILGIPSDKFVLLFLGQIRNYKNVNGLVNAFNELQDADKFLLIAGEVKDELSSKALSIIESSVNIIFINTFVKDDDLQVFINSSDMVVTPYKRIFNSGSLLLNLSFNRPTLGPRQGAFIEMESLLGSKYIKLFDGELSVKDLQKSIMEVRHHKCDKTQLDLSPFLPKDIANSTAKFFKMLLKSKSGNP